VKGYLVWQWLRDGKSNWYCSAGDIGLIIYGVVPTQQPLSDSFGRVYATYGEIFIVLSLLWRWKIDNVFSDKFDLIGGVISFIDVLVIMYYPRG